MSSGLAGRCLCGAVTYDSGAEPLWVTICYCTFCQRATGSDRMIEPVFDIAGFRFTRTQPSVFSLPSEGSGKAVHVHFCKTCGTKLALTFERWPDRIGIYLGTLDEPSALTISPETTKHIFTSEARPGTILPPGVTTYARHAAEADGTPCEPVVHRVATVIGG